MLILILIEIMYGHQGSLQASSVIMFQILFAFLMFIFNVFILALARVILQGLQNLSLTT